MALKHRLHQWLRWATIVLLALLVFDAYHWRQAATMNTAITDGSIIAIKHELPAEALFAQAYFHAQQSNQESATALYKQVERMGELDLKNAARYNRANSYLQRAMEMDASGDKQQGMPLAEMAKDAYRVVLRSKPATWDAKYNLERALRFSPDSDDSDDADLPPPEQSERALTTMRGFTLGLP